VSRGDPSIPAALRTAILKGRARGKPVIKSVSLDDGSTAFSGDARAADSTRTGAAAECAAATAIGAGEVAAYVNEAKRKRRSSRTGVRVTKMEQPDRYQVHSSPPHSHRCGARRLVGPQGAKNSAPIAQLIFRHRCSSTC
jgi:hypothetical protein